MISIDKNDLKLRDGMVNLMAEALVNNLEIYKEDNTNELFFTLCTGKVGYNIEINYITKIVGLHEMIKITGVHNNVKGFVNFKDRIIPVIDVQIRFNKELKAYNRSYILIIELKKVLVGIIVDKLYEVLNMDIVINYLVMMNLIKLGPKL